MFFAIHPLKKIHRKIILFLAMFFVGLTSFAEGPPPPSSMSNPFVVMMVIVMIILALAIGLLANVLLGVAQVQSEKEKDEKKSANKKISSATATTAAGIIALLFLCSPLAAQDKAASVAATTNVTDSISSTTFYMMAGVIFLELIVVIVLLYNLKLLLNIQKNKITTAEGAVEYKPRVSLWDKINSFKPVEQEVTIDLGHDYDGIRELDNRLPPWWLYGFYCTIIFAGIYLWRYHVSHTAPLSGEEFQIAMQQASLQREAYLKKAANNVDETTVKFLSDGNDLASGKTIFETTCFPCHGKFGEGGVGPNLTDDYWLHGGDIKDIFKTIKYGWPEKGMKSWKDDYSPVQIAQLSSYIKSLHGSNPANAKAPQGTVDIISDSTSNKKDSVKTAALQ
ncbi:MAG: c-type cytochrome [Bacteroidetes bacterium]|nr:c-type cytochrome [Bacteroidota bacterium]